MGGSSTAAGLDGSNWALSQNVIVVFIQYRLGLFGWLQTAELVDETGGGAPGDAKVSGNMALRDIVVALQQIKTLAPSFGGDASKITVMGQSSGAQMVRALLTTSSASSLFARAILVSDTENYGPAKQSDSNALGAFGLDQLNCTDLACARAANKHAILDAGFNAYQSVPQSVPSVSAGTPFRPTLGSFFSTAIELGTSPGKPLLMTTVNNEAGSSVGNTFMPSAAKQTTVTLRNGDIALPFGAAAEFFFNDGRGDPIAAVPAYTTDGAAVDQTRAIFEGAMTDGLWRCATQTNARNMAGNGASVWLAQINVGAQYPSNAGNDYCSGTGKVCHEDDLYVIFGTAPNASSAVKSASKQLQARYAAFAKNGSPNVPSTYATWNKVASGTQLNMLLLGSNGVASFAHAQRPDLCGGNMWGKTVPFDWQLYSH